MPRVAMDGPADLAEDLPTTETVVLDAVADLVAEVQAVAAPVHPTLDSRFERDLGLDSLAIAELESRLEQLLAVRLPESVLATVDTPRELVRALRAGGARRIGGTRAVSPPAVPAPVSAPEQAGTLLEVLDAHARSHPERVHLTVLHEDRAERVDYASLRREAAATARGLVARGIEPGETVALMLPTSREYFTTFFGVLLAGAVPVPIYPPARRSQIEDHLRRHARILENARAAALVTTSEARRLARLVRARVPALRDVVDAAELPAGGRDEHAARVGSHDLALLQYTSGSTGAPKGVMLTHANLLANIRAMGRASGVTSDDVFVSWLPLYHDMGLIGAWLGSLYYGFAFVVMPPPSFLTRPSRWLSAIGNFRGTISAAPNFGYELCLAKLTDADLEGVDLSSWRLAFNGAEPVSPHTVERFAERFERFGLRREAIAPVYGLAEACVGLAFPPPGRGPVIDRLDRDRFVRSGRAVAAGDDDTNPLRVVACGRALPGHAMRVVDAAGNELGDRQEGRIEFRGPSATSGYFRNPDATARLLDGEWLDTGDLGYLADGDVYVTGRVKDLVIRAGRNLHPDELEAALNALPGVRKGRVAVFAASDPSSGTERLVVLAETRETDDARRSRLRDAILGVTVDILGTPPDEIVLARPGIVLKTSSGKVRRAACRELYEHGRVDAVPRAPWWQLTRVAASTALPRFRRGRRALCGIGFALYAWLCVLVLVPVGAFLVTVLPGRRTRWAVTRALTRALLRTTGTPFTVLGLDSLPRGEPCVVVANHASWLDAVVLGAALPGRPCFVAASELARRRWMRLLLSRLGTEFVQRAARGQSVADTHRLLERSRAGETLVVFPEGRLAQAPGVRPFHLGAFVVAAAARRPVVPVAIRGTRSVLHPGRRLPRRGAITVEVCDALRARDTGWRGAIELRSDAHAAIVAHSDERDVAGPSRLTS
jgi:1-acyl-sn-glycerol-3-phosphate acyltransferase